MWTGVVLLHGDWPIIVYNLGNLQRHFPEPRMHRARPEPGQDMRCTLDSRPALSNPFIEVGGLGSQYLRI